MMSAKRMMAGALAASLGMAAMLSPLAARPLTPAENRYSAFSANLPACDDSGVLSKISGHFASREGQYWNSDLRVETFDRFREIGFRSNGLDYVPRRYCTARVLLNDAKYREVTYAIGENLGFIGLSYGVDWCIRGLDRNHAYDPGCKMARP